MTGLTGMAVAEAYAARTLALAAGDSDDQDDTGAGFAAEARCTCGWQVAGSVEGVAAAVTGHRGHGHQVQAVTA